MGSVPFRPAAGALRRAVMLIACATSCAFALAPSVAAADTALEAETMTAALRRAAQSSDSRADLRLTSGSEALLISSSRAATRTIALDDPVARVALRARGRSCNGSPIAALTIGGKRVLRVKVSAGRSYREYSSAVELPGGRHKVRLSLVNSRRTHSCSRGLIADRVTFATAPSVESEAMSLPSRSGRAVRDASASGGAALRLWSNAGAQTTTRLDAADAVVVRARGNRCSGAPRLALKVDGRTLLTANVSSSRWKEYRAPVTVPSGSHAVRAEFTNDYRRARCDRNLEIDSIDFRRAATGGSTPPTAAPPIPAPTRPASTAPSRRSSGPEPVPARPRPIADAPISSASADMVFDSNFTNGLSEYVHQTHSERIHVVDDPVLGSARKVLQFKVYNSDTGPTENPRAQLETPYDFDEGDDRYFGFSYYFPSDFPTQLPSQAWVTLGEQAYGPPYDGAGGTSLRVQNHGGGGGAELRWQRNDTYAWDIPWTGPRIADIKGRWVDIVQRVKLHHDPNVGFVEMWMNTGGGWTRQKLAGQDRLHMSTFDAANNGGSNNSRLSLYYRKDIPGPITLYHGPHKIAAAGPGAFEAVAPTSY